MYSFHETRLSLFWVVHKAGHIPQNRIPYQSFLAQSWLYVKIGSLINIERSMSLFIGNVSKRVTGQQFEDAFKSYGNCKIDLRKRYAFVQFQSERCAEEAKNNLQNVNFSGLRLNIEWSKNSGRFNQNTKGQIRIKDKKRGRSPSRERSWRKEEKYFRRSPSYERRTAPNYQQNQEALKTFVPQGPRDKELYRRLTQHRQEKMKPEQPVQEMELEAGEAI